MKRTLLATALVATTIALPTSATAHGGGGHCDFNGDGYDDAAIGVPREDIGDASNAGAVHILYGSESGLKTAGDQFFHQGSAGLNSAPADDESFGTSVECGDFDDDGHHDLAIGVPLQDVRNEAGGGAVHVLYGSADGLLAEGSQYLHRDRPGISGKGGGWFGNALASGDFNGDGVDDLAVGVRGDRVAKEEGAGSVHVFYGSGSGLSVDNDEIWHKDTPGVKGKIAAEENFGHTLASGDFDGSGHDDLAIGVPADRVSGISRAGSVSIIYGSDDGLTDVGNQVHNRAKAGMLGTPAQFARLGESLAAGDFDGDGVDDLVAGVPGDDISGKDGAGSFHVLYGMVGGLSRQGDQIWHRDRGGVRADPGVNHSFGWALSSGDFDGDGYDDIVAGVPGEDPGNAVFAGSVHVFHGDNSGIRSARDQIWHQGRPGIRDKNEIDDLFGYSVGSGDFDGDGAIDAIIGVPGEGKSGVPFTAGRLAVIYGADQGMISTGNQSFHQDTQGIKDEVEPGDFFGWALAGKSHFAP